MIYVVKISEYARKQLKKLNKQESQRIVIAIGRLRTAPRAGSVKKLTGSSSWRLRVGDYRVVYDIYDDVLVVLVVKVAHRKEVYRTK